MKKLIAFMLVLCILCSIPVSAMAAKQKTAAAGEEVKEYLWSDVKDAIKEADVSGRFVTFDEIALTFWLPDEFTDMLEEGDKEDGFIGYYGTENDEYVVVTYDESDWDDLEELAKDMIAEEIDGVEIVTLNGLSAVEYLLPDEDNDEAVYWCLALLTDAGNIVTITIYPVTSEEDTQTLAFLILSSIQPEDALEAAA